MFSFIPQKIIVPYDMTVKICEVRFVGSALEKIEEISLKLILVLSGLCDFSRFNWCRFGDQRIVSSSFLYRFVTVTYILLITKFYETFFYF
jgi:hypothetical protein